MRVVVAPDKFAGTLTAVVAARAILDGWHRGAPHDEVRPVPMSDGGTGFVEVVRAAVGGDVREIEVTGPLGDPVAAGVLLAGDDAYVECAQACGIDLLAAEDRDIWHATTYGVGQLVGAALDAGARRIYVGLGGSVTNDGGAGLLAALGAEPADLLRGGPAALADLPEIDLTVPHERLAGVELVVAADVDNPLLGLRGASNVYGRQKGARAADLSALDAALDRLAEVGGRQFADAKGAGAAGGLGYALLLLGGRRVPGFATVAGLTGLAAALDGAGIVVTGEGALDGQSMRGKVVSGVAAAAGQVGAACVVLAGRVDVGRREMNANGIEAAYALVDLPGGRADALGQPAATLAALAERVARVWSPPR